MKNENRILAVIPARGGSIGLPGKNIRLLSGKPLIVWTIEAALASKVITKLVVSTDDKKIADIGKKYGAEIPFLRPANLATDEATTADVLIHAYKYFSNCGEKYTHIMLLQPTSPLRAYEDIVGSVNWLNKKNAQAVVSVCEAEHHPYWSNTLPSDWSMINFIKPECHNRNRQQLPPCYRINGAVYIAEWNYFYANRGFFGDSTFAYLMPRERSVDIDSLIDFLLAETILSNSPQTY
ncbi:MAG: acylneuraminate cytidylyltransferase family protein [Candidatus Wallbacteria bacterium]|nr:acylneuraminate cytidylyltransferase family protein [Candidatus Wallbacteria bacterium]